MKNVKSVLFCLTLLLIIPSFNSCDKIDEISYTAQDAIRVLEKGIDNISAESSAWRYALEDIQDELPDELERSTESIKEQVSQLMAEGIGMAGSNLVCVADAIPKRIIRGLKVLIAQLKDQAPPLVIPTVCQTTLAVIDLNKPFFQRDKIVVYGYDFKEDEGLSLWARRKSNNVEYEIQGKLFKISDYQYSIVLDGLDEELKRSNALVLRFDGDLVSEFGIISDSCGSVNCLNGGECVDGTCECETGFTGSQCQTAYKFRVTVDFHTFESKKSHDSSEDEYRMTIETKVPGHSSRTIPYHKDGEPGYKYTMYDVFTYENVPTNGKITISATGYEEDRGTSTDPHDQMGSKSQEYSLDVRQSSQEMPIRLENAYFIITGTINVQRVP